MPKGNTYSDIELMEALLNSDGNISRAARELGVTVQSVRKRKNGLPVGVMGSTKNYREVRAEVFADLQKMLLRYITPDKLKKASLAQIGTLFGIFYDKERLERGQATEHIAHAHYQALDDDSKKMLKDTIQQLTEKKLNAIDYGDDD